MMRAATILWAVLAAAAGTSLFMLKYEVQAQEQRLSGLRKDIVEAQESIHVMKAEWSYLNDPARLREQAERHLGLHPLKPNQIVTIASLPMRDPKTDEAPIAQGPALPQAAPAVTVPPAPVVTRKTPSPPLKAAPGPAPAPVPSKPARSMMAEKAPPAPAAGIAKAAPGPAPKVVAKAVPASKPAVKPGPAKPTAVASAKPVKPTTTPAQPRPAAGATPVYTSTPARSASSETASSGNVMVIKSPALADPEVASTRAQP
ncbi:cell division protein FtsL [Telmatospirillum siberiense]|uniref:Energy transducer TonB n=1 Tax=Telmatospirillum siberiense TaxID=382514 RepID=A0A2N3PQK7_9PROT|nr:energy transducer TonB [Telmatospirillum siberiense]PKU22681.1 energy transducer TonB [Telmatospirillum siberiense]